MTQFEKMVELLRSIEALLCRLCGDVQILKGEAIRASIGERSPCRECGEPLDHKGESAFCTKCALAAVVKRSGQPPPLASVIRKID
jgi:hypothetical protein